MYKKAYLHCPFDIFFILETAWLIRTCCNAQILGNVLDNMAGYLTAYTGRKLVQHRLVPSIPLDLFLQWSPIPIHGYSWGQGASSHLHSHVGNLSKTKGGGNVWPNKDILSWVKPRAQWSLQIYTNIKYDLYPDEKTYNAQDNNLLKFGFCYYNCTHDSSILPLKKQIRKKVASFQLKLLK